MKKEHKQDLLTVLQEVAPDREKLDSFLRAILTPQEFEEIVLRLQIVKQLREGKPQREIAKDLKTGIATVTRGARELRTPKNGFDTAFTACEKGTAWNWRTKNTVCR